MSLNYSKWDNLEVSDDSDIEEHPNVDKRSMIRWKQQAIHEERERRKHRIEYLEQLQKQQNNALTALDQATRNEDNEHLAENWKDAYGKLKPSIYDEDLRSVLDGLSKLLTDNHGSETAKQALQGAQETIEKKKKAADEEYSKLVTESNKKITSDNMFVEKGNRTIINKGGSSASASKPTTKTKTEKTIEVLNPQHDKVNVSEPTAPANDDDDDDDEVDDDILTMSDDVRTFSKIEGFQKSYDFIKAHNSILAPDSKAIDQLLAAAFQAQREGKDKYTWNCIVQAEALQLCNMVGLGGVARFFEKLIAREPQAENFFFGEVKAKFERVRERCKVLAAEQEDDPGVETIQLQTVSGGSELTVCVPDSSKPDEKAAYEVYTSLPEKFRKALETGKLDTVNKALEKIEATEAERILEICSSHGFIDLSEQLIDETGQDQ